MVKSLGADKVIDFTKEDLSKSDQTYDIIFDTVWKTSVSRCKNLLKQRGVYLTADWPLLEAPWTSLIGSKKVIFGVADKRIEDLTFLKEPIEAGKIKSVMIDAFRWNRLPRLTSMSIKGIRREKSS